MTTLYQNARLRVTVEDGGDRNSDNFCMSETKRRLHDRTTQHFKALKKSYQASAISDLITSTGNNIKLDHFEFLATGRSVVHCRI